MAFKWTKEQEAAIHTTGKSLLVSAAAGSGKTAVLAERCAYLVCDAPDRCEVDELLVVTFTNAAATEMRDRIERRLRDKLEQSDDPALLKQLALIDRAQISTLHGFCSQVLRQHFHVLGVDPNFTQLAEEEAALLRSEVARELFADRYASEKTGGDFQKFIDLYGNGNDEPLVWRVIQTHELLASMIDAKTWINHALGRIKDAAERPLAGTELGRQLTKLINDGLADLRRRAIEASGRLAEMQGLSHYAEYMNDMLAIIGDWQDQFGGGNFDALAEAVKGAAFGRLPSIRGIDPEVREAGKTILDSVRKEMTEGTVAQLCRFSVAEWQDGLRRIAGPSKVFLDLVLDFSRRYRDAKNERRAIDFSDLERMALKVLRDETKPGLIPTDAARGYQAQFKHVLVDEYQDINAVQDAILCLVSRECLVETDDVEQNLFCVGDVKQSIYRFRLADPQRFAERGKKFRNGNPKLGAVIDLQANFRSRGPLIEVLNGMFQRLMTEVAAEIEYDETQMLRAGLPYPANGDGCFQGAPVELQLLPKVPRGELNAAGGEGDDPELERSEREAVVIAHRIREMMGLVVGKKRAQVFEKTEGGLKARDIQYKDIVILLRSMKVKADDFADQLRMAGIAVHSDSGTGFFQSMEVRDVLSLLHLLDNQRQDIPMAAVLRSPLCKLPCADDCLAKIHLHTKKFREPMPFHQAVVSYARNEKDELAACLRDFLKQLDAWRTMAHQRPLAEVLWTIYDSTGYLAFCAGLEDGEQRVVNLISLHERARQFGTFQRQGIGRFMRFIEDLQEQSDLGQPAVASEADDVVRIMSIHRSKGLEFPVVFLPDLGKRHNLRDSHGMILVDREAYLGMQAVDEERRIRYPSLAWMLVQDRLKKQMLAEELRVLYVAATRAREHLILLGSCDEGKWDGWKSTWGKHEGAIPAEDVLRGGCMLDWIGPVAAAMESSKPGCFAVQSYSEEELVKLANQMDRRVELSEEQTGFAKLEPLKPAPLVDQAANEVIERLTRSYPWKDLTEVPAAESVTGLTKLGKVARGGESKSQRGMVKFDRELAVPRCVIKTAIAPSATEVGSATHLVLQHLDLEEVASVADIRKHMAGLVERKVIVAKQSEMVDVEGILWLAGSELGKLVGKNRGAVRREMPVYFAKEVDARNAVMEPMDRVMVRGRLDLMVQTNQGIVIADYKTDQVTKETIGERVEFYGGQIKSYADAIREISGQQVKHAYLAFLSARMLVDVATK